MAILFLLFSQMVKDTTKTETLPIYEKSPMKAVILSTLFPGGGQIYTENYLKGIIFTSGEGLLLYFTIKEKEKEKRSNLIWWTAALHIFNIADAYVSAHLYKFEKNKRIGAKISPISIGLTINFP